MNKYKKLFQDSYYLMGISKIKLSLIFILFLVSGFLDIVSLALVGPFIAFANEPSAAKQFIFWDYIDEYIFNLSAITNENVILLLGLIIIFTFLVKAITAYFIRLFIAKFSLRLECDLRSRLMKTYQNLPYLFHVTTNTASIIQCIYRYTSVFANGIVMPVLTLLAEIITILAILVLLSTTNILAVLSLLAITTLFITFYIVILKDKLYLMGKSVHEGEENIIKGIQQSFDGYKEISILGKKKYFYEIIKKNADRIFLMGSRFHAYQIMPRYLIELTMVTFIVFFVILLTKNATNTQNALPVLGIFVAASLRIIPSINQIVRSINQIKNSIYAASRLLSDLKEIDKFHKDRDLNIKENKDTFERFEELNIKSIDFSYPGTNDKAIKNISLNIKQGECIGIIGKTGSGKTTLIDIMLGFLNPSNGDILANNTPIKNDLKSWMSLTAYIPQSIFLIDDTIKKNIALGIEDSEINLEMIKKSLSMSRLDSFVENLPEKIETVIGERGMRLSGGQRQRIALARAFYFQRQIIVMDEATSSLDNETEKEVIDSINRMKRKITMLVIAHRLSTVKNCDYIYKIEDGEIIESGIPEKILQVDN
ncbi:MAG: hypothetical protein CMF53_06305 [Legionellales bacterium]|nr:hypothetical protein [Legionellales bacterium]|tara:strand:- start:1141 stop:2928 length:1788 start_codon:yes stop_codon:yes gene_type:complete